MTSGLPATADVAGLGVIEGAGRGRQGAGRSEERGVGGEGIRGGDLREGCGTGEGEDDDESADDVLHDVRLRKL